MHTETFLNAPALFAAAPAPSDSVTLRFEDAVLTVPAGITLAAALLMRGVDHFRTTPISVTPRAPYCMMGVCFECLVEIDGKSSRQACLTVVREGMIVRRQQGASVLPTIKDDKNGK